MGKTDEKLKKNGKILTEQRFLTKSILFFAVIQKQLIIKTRNFYQKLIVVITRRKSIFKQFRFFFKLLSCFH